jgi:hypothetical protein
MTIDGLQRRLIELLAVPAFELDDAIELSEKL